MNYLFQMQKNIKIMNDKSLIQSKKNKVDICQNVLNVEKNIEKQ